MGQSAIEFRGNISWWSEGDIELWLFALVREIEKLPKADDWLADARRLWRKQFSIGFGHSPDPHLDKICTSNDRIERTIELAQSALSTLSSNPLFRREELIQAGVGGDIRWTCDQPATGAIGVGRAFIELLKKA